MAIALIRSADELLLNRIPVSRWVFGTIERMKTDSSKETWNNNWLLTYRALGGDSQESGIKECPKAAAYALWRLGVLKGTDIPRRKVSLAQVVEEFGKNGAYAFAALVILSDSPSIGLPELWKLVQSRFEVETGLEAAGSEQGAARIALILFKEGNVRR
jgi:hypothetical protein